MASPRLVVITDLDGTLLDHSTYSYEASLPAVERLKGLKVPLVLCSSKTRSEILPLWRQLGLADPFISENGGAIYFPPDCFSLAIPGIEKSGSWRVLKFGAEIGSLRRALADAARQSRVKVKSFGEMSPEEIASLTGLSVGQAALALEREYDEPFLVEVGDPQKLISALAAGGWRVTRGGRFFHVTGGHDKGKAVKALVALYRQDDPAIGSVGLGNSANDLPLLRQVDRPFLVRNKDGSHDPQVLEEMPEVERTREAGPGGWREAIETVLASEKGL